MVKISKRLEALADLVPEGKILADVGTDHGYIPISLLLKQNIPYAIAMDINKGPLKRAEENRNRHALQDKMELRLSDGLQALSPNEADTILIAGMGGPLMVRILEDGFATVEAAEKLILQPQSEISGVRRYLSEHGFSIDHEIMLKDEGKYYTAMTAVRGKAEPWKETEYLFGKILLEEKNPVLLEFLYKERKVYTSIMDKLRESHQEHNERFKEIYSYICQIDQALAYYDNKG